jgi:hypothetical protein
MASCPQGTRFFCTSDNTRARYCRNITQVMVSALHSCGGIVLLPLHNSRSNLTVHQGCNSLNSFLFTSFLSHATSCLFTHHFILEFLFGRQRQTNKALWTVTPYWCYPVIYVLRATNCIFLSGLPIKILNVFFMSQLYMFRNLILLWYLY